MLITERAIYEKERIEKEVKDLKSKIKNLPNGRIECHRRGDGWRWYEVKNGEKRAIKKRTELVLAERLAYKSVLKKRLDKLEQHLKALEIFIENDSPSVINTYSDKRLKDNPEIMRLANDYESSRNTIEAEWLADDNSEYMPEGLSIISKTGRRVRSKSEAIIDACLADHGLTYRYEAKVNLNGKQFLPDFVILNPNTNEPIMWEHFGMMDERAYSYKNMKKIMSYIESGFVPMRNIITTFETREQALDARWVETIIEYFFE